MKAVYASLLAITLAAIPLAASTANTDRTLENAKGTVTYGQANPATTPLALHARTQLSDNDFADTGADSLATLTLPDSSQVILGSDSSVQMKSFTMTNIANASFVVVGKVRFKVNHPSGARANYQFQTTTGQIAVRGTEGDILANQSGMQVNVYAVSNPAFPVQVTLANGQVFTLAAGQSLVATAVAGTVTASVTSVTQSLFTPFQELGAPVNAGTLGITTGATTAAGAGAGAGAAAATAAVGAGAAAAAVTTLSNNKGTPTATPAPPAPAPSSTSVPITVSGGHRAPSLYPGRGRPGPRPSPHA